MIQSFSKPDFKSYFIVPIPKNSNEASNEVTQVLDWELLSLIYNIEHYKYNQVFKDQNLYSILY